MATWIDTTLVDGDHWLRTADVVTWLRNSGLSVPADWFSQLRADRLFGVIVSDLRIEDTQAARERGE